MRIKLNSFNTHLHNIQWVNMEFRQRKGIINKDGTIQDKTKAETQQDKELNSCSYFFLIMLIAGLQWIIL